MLTLGVARIAQIARAYEAGGAACLSVLTDAKYFQGSFEHLRDIRAAGVAAPLLCKEFIVEAYQLFKARCLCSARPAPASAQYACMPLVSRAHCLTNMQLSVSVRL